MTINSRGVVYTAYMLLSTPQCDQSFTALDFSLPDVISGKDVSLNDGDLSNGFVVSFICNHCPYVQAAIKQFVKTAATLKEQDILVFAIMSNNYVLVEDDSPEHMKEFASLHNFSFPYLVDEDQSVAKAYGAVCTPDFFGFNNERSMQYRGNVEGLSTAMLEIKETGKGPTEQSCSRGCSIKWK